MLLSIKLQNEHKITPYDLSAIFNIFWSHTIAYKYFYIAFIVLFCSLTDVIAMNGHCKDWYQWGKK